MSKALRGEVWEVEFKPAVGAEIQKIRPAVVMNVPDPNSDWSASLAKSPQNRSSRLRRPSRCALATDRR
jgi:mRNA-degrading endonuclease toxin of MazEF toxin-antitoxin module